MWFYSDVSKKNKLERPTWAETLLFSSKLKFDCATTMERQMTFLGQTELMMRVL